MATIKNVYSMPTVYLLLASALEDTFKRQTTSELIYILEAEAALQLDRSVVTNCDEAKCKCWEEYIRRLVFD